MILLCYFSYLSAPTKKITEMVADQVAPSYWVPNKDTEVNKLLLIYNKMNIFNLFLKVCSSCKLLFGVDYTKHHCRGLLAHNHIIKSYLIFLQHVAIFSAIRAQRIALLFHCSILKHLNVYAILVIIDYNLKHFHQYFKIIICILNEQIWTNLKLAVLTVQQVTAHPVSILAIFICLISFFFLMFYRSKFL